MSCTTDALSSVRRARQELVTSLRVAETLEVLLGMRRPPPDQREGYITRVVQELESFGCDAAQVPVAVTMLQALRLELERAEQEGASDCVSCC
jgi:hypothetical protein